MKRVRPEEFDDHGPELHDASDALAVAAAAVIGVLANRWTAWRVELGFDKEGAQ